MGANQSGESRRIDEDSNSQNRILVVNPTPGRSQPEASITLPKRVQPILSLEGHRIDPNRHKPHVHQLNQDLWMDFIVMVNDFAKSRSELTATRQNLLREKIVQVDEHVQKFTDSYVNGKHKALALMNDDCRKMDDIGKLFQKCLTQSELCVSMLNKLNFLLPDEHKLEPLEP